MVTFNQNTAAIQVKPWPYSIVTLRYIDILEIGSEAPWCLRSNVHCSRWQRISCSASLCISCGEYSDILYETGF